MVITQRALAAELGVHESRVSHYVKRGMPVVDGGVDRDVAIEWIQKNIIPQGGRNADKGADRVSRMRRSSPAEDEQLDPPQERARRDRAATRAEAQWPWPPTCAAFGTMMIRIGAAS